MAPSLGSSGEVSAWKKLAESCQHEIRAKLYGNREFDFFDATVSGKSLLRKKIAFAMFGPAASQTLDLNQKKNILLSKIFNLVCTQNVGQSSFRVSFVYVECLTREKMFYTTVIRLHLADETNEKIVKCVFIDNVPRSYDDFDDYLDYNRLPKCIMCYPATGAYFLQPREKNFQVKFRKSPACNIRNKVLRSLKISLVVKHIVECLHDTYCLCCPWCCKSSANDGDHGMGQWEMMRLRIQETRECWLAIGNSKDPSVKGFIAARRAAQEESNSTKPAEINALTVSLKVSVLDVINEVAIIVMKFFQDEPITAVNLVYLVSACFLFANVRLTTFHAKKIINEMLKIGVKPENFLKELAIVVKKRPECGKLAKRNEVVNLAPLGIFYTLPKPKSDLQTGSKAVCKLIESCHKQYATTFLCYAEKIDNELYDFWCSFGYEMQSIVEYFCEINGKTALCEIFGKITSHEALEFTSCLVDIASWFHTQGGGDKALERLRRVIIFQDKCGTVKPEDGIEKRTEEYQRIGQLLKTEFLEQSRIYQEGYKRSKEHHSDLTESVYKDVVNITGSLNEHFCEQALTQMSKAYYNQERSLKVAKRLLIASSAGLKDDETGTTIHFYHGVSPEDSEQRLSRDQYFLVARERVGSVLDNVAFLEVHLDSRVGFFREIPANAEGITCVIVTCVPEEGLVAGHIFVVKC